MTERFVLVVSLWVRADQVVAYEAFEQKAALVMAQYGGKIERVLRRAAAASASEPFEVHVVTFPNAAAFEAYKVDEAAKALAPLRNQVIEKTTLFVATDRLLYGSSRA